MSPATSAPGRPGEPLGGKLPHRDDVGKSVPRRQRRADAAIAGERVKEVQRLVLSTATTRVAASIVHPSANTDSASTSRAPGREQPEAPLDGGPQGALTLGEVDQSRAQRVEDVLVRPAAPPGGQECGPRRARSPAAARQVAGRSPSTAAAFVSSRVKSSRTDRAVRRTRARQGQRRAPRAPSALRTPAPPAPRPGTPSVRRRSAVRLVAKIVTSDTRRGAIELSCRSGDLLEVSSASSVGVCAKCWIAVWSASRIP